MVVTNDNDLRTTASVSEIKPILISVDHFLERMKKADENMKEAIKMTGDGKTRVVTAQKACLAATPAPMRLLLPLLHPFSVVIRRSGPL